MATDDIVNKIESALNTKQDASKAMNEALSVDAIKKSIEEVDKNIGIAIQEELNKINIDNSAKGNPSNLKYQNLGSAAIPLIKGIYAAEPDKLKAFEDSMAKLPSKENGMESMQEQAYNLLLARKSLIQDSEEKIAEFEKVDNEFITEINNKEKELKEFSESCEKIIEELENLKNNRKIFEERIKDLAAKLSDPTISADDRMLYEADKVSHERTIDGIDGDINKEEINKNEISVKINDATKEKKDIENSREAYKTKLSKFKDSVKGQQEKGEEDSKQFIELFKKQGLDFEAFAMGKVNKEVSKEIDDTTPNSDSKTGDAAKDTPKGSTGKAGQSSGASAPTAGANAPQAEQTENERDNLPISYEKDPSYRKMAKSRAKSLANKYKKLTGPRKTKIY